MHVYEAICNVTADLSRLGIAKDSRNQQQGYNFRGIDSVYNALSPILSKHKLCVLPRVIDRQVVERQTAKGGALFYTTVRMEFDFVSAVDGSKHTVATVGEAMDSGDKSSNKAMSAAYKYAAMQAFCIPTEGDNDADATTHEVASQGISSVEFADFQIAIRESESMESLLKIGDSIGKSKVSETQRAELLAEFSKRKRELKQAVAA